MAMITNDWLPALQEEFKKPYYKELYQFVQRRIQYRGGISSGGRYFQCTSSDTVKRCQSVDPRTGSVSQRGSGTWIVFFGKAG